MKKIKLSGNNELYALVDDEDYDRLCEWKWQLDKRGYARRNASKKGLDGVIRWKTVLMHRAVLGVEYNDASELCVDHINGNPLDNRKENLRIVNYSENASNRHKTTASTKVLRVSKCGNGYIARIRVNKNSVYIGSFATITEAEIAIKKYQQEKIVNRKMRSDRRVKQLTSDGGLIATYCDCTEAGRSTGIAPSNINRCVNGRRMTAGGYRWQYVS